MDLYLDKTKVSVTVEVKCICDCVYHLTTSTVIESKNNTSTNPGVAFRFFLLSDATVGRCRCRRVNYKSETKYVKTLIPGKLYTTSQLPFHLSFNIYYG